MCGCSDCKTGKRGKTPCTGTPRENPSTGRNIARHYAQECGWKKSEARAIWKAKKGNPPPRSSRRAMTRNEQRAFLVEAAKESYPVNVALGFALATGLRVSELVKVKRSDCDATGFSCLGKGQKTRRVPLSPDARQLLAMLPRTGYLFPGNGAKGHVSTATIEAACKRIGKRASSVSWVTPHVLRHSYASNAVMACTPPEALRDALGHDSIKTTHTYIGTIATK